MGTNTGMFPTSEEVRTPIKLFPPSLNDEVRRFEGWSVTLSFLTPWPNVYRIHQFMPMRGQDPIKTFDNRVVARDRMQRCVCLGSPRKPFNGEFELALDPEGVKLCESIKLPDGSSLHDCSIEMTSRGSKVDWRYIFPVYVWNEKTPYVVDGPWTDKFVKAILGARASQRDRSVEDFAVTVSGHMEGRAKCYTVEVVAAPGPTPQADPSDQRWLDVGRVANPYMTPEAAVERLGVARYNTQFAPQSAPQAASSFFGQGPIGDDEDPFGDQPQPQQVDEQV